MIGSSTHLWRNPVRRDACGRVVGDDWFCPTDPASRRPSRIAQIPGRRRAPKIAGRRCYWDQAPSLGASERRARSNKKS